MCVSNSWLCLELAVLLYLLVEAPWHKVQLLLLGKHAERLKYCQDGNGIGATVFHHPKTKILPYKKSLEVERNDEQLENDN